MILPIGAVMNEGVVAVHERSGVPELVATIERCRPRTVAVVDAFGRLLGAIDRDEHPHLFLYGTPPHTVNVAGTRRQRDLRLWTGSCTARELMSPFPVVTDTWTITEALRSLDGADADLAFVVDQLGRVLGTVTTLVCRAVLGTTTDPEDCPGADRVTDFHALSRAACL